MPSAAQSTRPAFSLVELIIVMVIIGLISAIAIPRFGASRKRAAEAKLNADLHTLRQAIELYWVEHDSTYPAAKPSGSDLMASPYPSFRRQLLMYTNIDGEAVEKPRASHALGSYLRAIPPLSVGRNAGNDAVIPLQSFNRPGMISAGWEYLPSTGEIRSCTGETEVGTNGIAYYKW